MTHDGLEAASFQNFLKATADVEAKAVSEKDAHPVFGAHRLRQFTHPLRRLASEFLEVPRRNIKPWLVKMTHDFFEEFHVAKRRTRKQGIQSGSIGFAMGAMICDRGQPVPIILDDALVFSDDDRIEQMFDALNRAGLKQQLIVLTCRTRAFALLGGQQLSITPSPG